MCAHVQWVLIKCSEYMGISAWGHWEAVTNGSITVTPTRDAMMSYLLSQGFINQKYAAVLGQL